MKERLQAAGAQIAKLWGSLSILRRVVLLGAMVLVLGGVLGVSFLTTRETYTFLFTDLSAEDAAAIVSKLKELKVPYQLEVGGSAIQVPEERVHELRLELASGGLPRGGGVGFEVFDKAHLGATEFEQHINLRRALEGELARTISTVGAVQSARVHLVLPERSVFAVTQDPASASVVLKLRPGRTFGRSEVASVVHLVSSAVPGLTADHVSIISSDGATLHRPSSMSTLGGGGGDDERNEREREVAASLELQARELLDRAVGPGHSDVRVHVELDPATHERTEEHYEPQKTALRSEQHTEERTSSEGPSVAGVPGAQSNLPTPSGTPAESTQTGLGGSVFRQSTTRNWEVDRVTEKTVLVGGKVARVSASVLVDGRYKGTGATREYIARDSQELDRLGLLVKGAIGFSSVRGDSLTIDTAPFVLGDPTEGSPSPVASRLPKLPVWAYGAIGGGVFLLLAMATLSARRKRVTQAETAVAPALAGAQAPEQLAGDGAIGALPSTSSVADEARERNRSEVFDLASKDPASAAIVLREWLHAEQAAASGG